MTKLFIDIETVRSHDTFESLPKEMRDAYKKKFMRETDDLVMPIEKHYEDKAGLFAEFGKIVCVSMGYLDGTDIRLTSFCSDNEIEILKQTASAIQKADGLVAHNGKDFDYPWLCRRMLIKAVPLPSLLRIQNLKPWEIKLEDTVEMWRFGQFSHKVSLAVMCHLFGIPSPKQNGDGSGVWDMYKAKDFESIAKYCEGDVIALVKLYQRLK